MLSVTRKKCVRTINIVLLLLLDNYLEKVLFRRPGVVKISRKEALNLLHNLIIEPDHLLVGEDGMLQCDDAALVVDH